MCMLHVHACIKNNIRKKIQGTVRPPSVLRPPLFRRAVGSVLIPLSNPCVEPARARPLVGAVCFL